MKAADRWALMVVQLRGQVPPAPPRIRGRVHLAKENVQLIEPRRREARFRTGWRGARP